MAKEAKTLVELSDEEMEFIANRMWEAASHCDGDTEVLDLCESILDRLGSGLLPLVQEMRDNNEG